MKIVHLSHSDISGGASRAAYRIHKMLIKNSVDSQMWVDIKKSDDDSVIQEKSKIKNFFYHKRQHLRFPINKLLKSSFYGMHSPSILPSTWLKKINTCDADVINLHWVQGEMLSIKEISRITKPLVWTFHDMWPFCGCEHYAYNSRYSDGYRVDNLSKNEIRFFDINRWRWKQKERFFKKPLQILSPSKWMTNCIKKSYLMKYWPVSTIPHPIDISKWKPLDKNLSRKQLDLPQKKKLIIFGAIGGTRDKRKGFELLELALKHLNNRYESKDLNLVIFGEKEHYIYSNIDYKIHNFNEIRNDSVLQKLYSAADVMVVPSILETFGLTASESLACGTPVVAFDNTGISDLIEHKSTGYLAKPLNVIDLANGLDWVLKNSNRDFLSLASRKRIIDLHSEKVVIKQYNKIYNETLLNR